MWNRDIYKKIQLADIANFVTEEEIFIDETLRYLNTHTANACAELSRSHFTRVRDYMLTNLILNNDHVRQQFIIWPCMNSNQLKNKMKILNQP